MFAQDLHYSLFQQSNLYFNPASTIHQSHETALYLQYRTQWIAITAPYQTYSLAFSQKKERLAYGLMLHQNQAGKASLKHTGGIFNVSYNILDKNNSAIALGANVGLLNKHFDPSDFTFDSQYNENTGFNAATPSGESFLQTNAMLLDATVGVNWLKKWEETYPFTTHIAFSLAHFNRPNESFLQNENNYRTPIKSILQARLIYPISRESNLEPVLFWQKQETYNEIVMLLQGNYSFDNQTKMSFGLGYRFRDAILWQIGVENKQHQIYFSYDNNNSRLQSATSGKGAFELSWNIRFGKKQAQDSDGDGIIDEQDRCPNVAGVAHLQGCPDDFDGDGIVDSLDRCPFEAGLLHLQGCNDTDKDGILDHEDGCPNLKGTIENHGCPTRDLDSDNDGVLDKNDKCIYLKGSAKFEGCPDSDNDGLSDIDDECPFIKGSIELKGCPAKETKKALLIQSQLLILFDTDSHQIRPNYYAELDDFIGQIDAFGENVQMIIEGHTDSEGDVAYNYQLSQKRCFSIQNYLLQKGFSQNSIKLMSYGEAKPVNTNDTAIGKQSNRRAIIYYLKSQ